VHEQRTGQPIATGEPALDVREAPGGITLRVRVKPRASHDAIEGVREGALVVRLTAPPVEGAANAALARVLAKALGLPPSAIALARGAKGRDKLVEIAGATTAQVASLVTPKAAKKPKTSV
jgi:uncharacterized protein (TIGR00251 family)